MADIQDLFERLTRFSGSDLHLRPDTPPMIRVHGTLIPMKSEDIPKEEVDRLVSEIIPEEFRETFEAKGEVDFAYVTPKGTRMRANAFKHRTGLGATFRLIPNEIPSAKQAHLSQPILNFCKLSKGLVLVTGPTGSGKSTTMAAIVDHINETRKEHIITIEEPIEFVHPRKRCLITQREVRTHTESFHSALRSALREDPDVVLVGEMRDLETTLTAIETAETGHLVMGTLHTTSASATVDRLIDQFPPEQQDQVRSMLSSCLAGVVSQTLLKKKDGMGMVAAREVMVINPAIKTLIREKKCFQISSQIETGKEQGMVMLNESIARFVQAGIVSKEEGFFKSVEREDMKRRLQAIPDK